MADADAKVPDKPATTAAAPADDMRALLREELGKMLPDLLGKIPPPKPVAAAAAAAAAPDLAARLREKWGLDEADDLDDLIDAAAPLVAKHRDRELPPAARRALKHLREVQARADESERKLREREQRDAEQRAVVAARKALDGLNVHNPDHVIAAAEWEGLLRADVDGDLAVFRDGKATGQTLRAFFEEYLRAHPHLVRAAPAGGPRVAPVVGLAVPPPDAAVAEKALLTREGRVAAMRAAATEYDDVRGAFANMLGKPEA